jgi:hypothetical protein
MDNVIQEFTTPVDSTPPVEPQRRFKGVWANDMKPILTRRDLIKGLVPKNALTVVWGAPSCGKSFWTLDAAMHIAINREYQGRRVVQGPVVYISGEGGKQINNRVEAWKRHNLETKVNIPLLCYDAAPVLPSDTEDLIDCIRRDLDGGKAAAVVVDTVNTVILGSTSNDDDMRDLVRSLRGMTTQLDCAALAIHHCGWDQGHMSGSRVLQADADCEIAVADDHGTRTVTHKKMRDGALAEPFSFELAQIDLGADEDGDPINSCAVTAVTTVQRQERGPRLNKNQKSSLDLLADSMPHGLPLEDWNAQAREAGIGVKRRADLTDIRLALKRKGLAHEYAGTWFVTTR